uniref:Glutaminyl-peptide cyclotransferase n=1 Tax=Kalanchoe fedtschenkoi TaxID=63787 RepID=A0A7N0TX60_KALFE
MPPRGSSVSESTQKRRSALVSSPGSATLRLGHLRRSIAVILLLSGFALPSAVSRLRNAPPAIARVRVVNEFPHDPHAFTQGLVYAGNDTLYESTGLYNLSSVRRVALLTGKVELLHPMAASYFGEGLTLLHDKLYQVTWLTKTGFIYDKKNLSEVKQFIHSMQDGWGLATDGNILFGSDGSSTLYLMDPKTFKVISKHIETYNGHEVYNLNELEFVNGEVWANIWTSDCFARISYTDGKVVGWILLQNLSENLISSGQAGVDVLNGIAWDDVDRRIFVTGKLWPKLYEIELHPAEKKSERSIERLCMREPLHLL